MDSFKSVARPGYLLATLFVLLPLTDAAVSMWPLRFGVEEWRFFAIGALSNIMLSPLLGLFLSLAIAVVCDHRRVRRVIGWIASVLAVVFMSIVFLFLLDFFQTRSEMARDYHAAAGVATTISVIKQLLTVLVLSWLGLAGLRGPKPMRKTERTARAEPTPLIPLSNGGRGA